jgi:hypothetical protein
MRARRAWRSVATDHDAEIEQLHVELVTLKKRIAEFEKAHPKSPEFEFLRAKALLLSRQVDAVRCSIATEQLAGLLAK